MTTPLKPIRAIDLVPASIKDDPELTKIAAEVARDDIDRVRADWFLTPLTEQQIYNAAVWRLTNKRINEYESAAELLIKFLRRLEDDEED